MGKKNKNKNRRRGNVGNYTRLDGHVHIYMRDNPLAGGDGGMELSTAIASAKANGVTHMIAVMHDSLGGFVKYVKEHNLDPNAVFHNIDGVQVSFGAEVTCRDFQNPNVKGNNAKMHLLVVAPRLTPDSPIVKLLELKTQNDIMFDFGRLMFVAESQGIKLDPLAVKEYVLEKSKHIQGYNSIGRKDVLDFFEKQGIDLALSQRGLDNLLDKAPPIPRMNIDMRDLIKVAHASGAMVIFAHPAVNLRRLTDAEKTIRNFYNAGGDGAESEYSESSTHFDTMMCDIGNGIIKGNKHVRFPGTDTHKIGKKSAVGKIKGKLITRDGQEKALEEFSNIAEARSQGRLTSRLYQPISQEEIDGIIAKYQAEHDANEKSYDQALERYQASLQPPVMEDDAPPVQGDQLVELDTEMLSEILDDVITEVKNTDTPVSGDDATSGSDGM